MNEWTTKELLIVAKTYPVISNKYEETVCTGAISNDGTWYRLYPVSFCYLEEEKKYPLWNWIKVKVKKNPRDDRKDTYAPDENSIEILDKKLKTERQKIDAVLPYTCRSLEELKEKYKTDKTSVGMIKIIPEKFYWEDDGKKWSQKQLNILNQQNLFHKKKPLEKIPYRFKLKYKCALNDNCPEHDQSILIWDWHEGYRNFVIQYGTEENALNKIHEAAMKNYFSKERECYAIVGNLANPLYRKTWIIGGFFSPLKLSLQQGTLSYTSR